MVCRLAFTSLFLLCFSSVASATDFDVYLIGGQSNANGRGDTAAIPVGSPLASPQTDVQFYWRKTQSGVINGNLQQDAFIDLQPGSGHGQNSPSGHVSEFGSELSLGRTIADALPNRNALIIKYSEGGTNLHTDWAAGGTQYNTFVDVVGDALAKLDANGDTYNMRGMAWLQGEADTSGSNATDYLDNLEDLILRVRDDVFDSKAAPFVLARLSDNQYSSVDGGVETVRQAQIDITNVLENVAYIDTDDDLLFTTYSNGLIHFDANGQINLGNAIGQKILVLSVPEPSSALLLGVGLAAFASKRRRSKLRS